MEWKGVELRGAKCSGAEGHGAGAPSCKVLELAVRLRLLREYQEEFWRVLISGKIRFIIENLHFVGRIPMCKDSKDEKWDADMYVGCISRVEYFLLVGQGCQKLVGVRCTVSNVIVMVAENQVLFLFGLVAEASVLIGENQVLFLFGVVAIGFLCLSHVVS